MVGCMACQTWRVLFLFLFIVASYFFTTSCSSLRCSILPFLVHVDTVGCGIGLFSYGMCWVHPSEEPPVFGTLGSWLGALWVPHSAPAGPMDSGQIVLLWFFLDSAVQALSRGGALTSPLVGSRFWLWGVGLAMGRAR